MREIAKEQVIERIRFENPWWGDARRVDDYFARMKRRGYFAGFARLVEDTAVRRAVILLGPRRVGKTVLLQQMIQKLLDAGTPSRRICYLSVDHPIYNGLDLDRLFAYCRAGSGAESPAGWHLFLDEVQYLPQWERHLKSLVDSYPRTRIVVSGSSAAALRMKSLESGAGRFTDFLLPPLTFHEYLELTARGELVGPEEERGGVTWFTAPDLSDLNGAFADYLNFGGYPEVALSREIRSDPGRYVRNDIIDKVLLRDLPSLYGIQDIQELNSLFTSLAYNSADEVSLEGLTKRSGVAKNTVKRYLEYLEAAFLIKRVRRIDRTARRFARDNFFKVYLTNPSIRSALFAPLRSDDADFGKLVETGIFAQWFHSTMPTKHYARWHQGKITEEIDIVSLDDSEPVWVAEVKWSDRFPDRVGDLRHIVRFCHQHNLGSAVITTISRHAEHRVENVLLQFVPASIYCYTVGRYLVEDI
jgi:uncharacterized protein